MEWIEELDRSLFLLINGLHSQPMDEFMWFLSGKLGWIPFYLILLFFVIKKFGKQSWIILLAVAVLIVLSDQTSVHLFKDLIKRYRPCHNLEIGELVHLVNNKCGGKYGFVSSHSANVFALATIIGLIFNRRALVLMFLWASLVAYSRIYLGVHYPLDVLGGAILGISLAYLIYYWMMNLFKDKLYQNA
jgi:undecaprenyl-diphosphatase